MAFKAKVFPEGTFGDKAFNIQFEGCSEEDKKSIRVLMSQCPFDFFYQGNSREWYMIEFWENISKELEILEFCEILCKNLNIPLEV